MASAEPGTEPVRQSGLFLALYALAAAGGSVAYVPFLTLLLPVRVSAMVGADAVGALAVLAFIGALSASVAHILFGWVSDTTGQRKVWVLLGLGLSGTLLIAMPQARTLSALAAMLATWQFGLNMMLAPLAAWAADTVPASQRGRLGGLLSVSPAMGAAAGALITRPGLADADTRLVLVAGLVAVLVLPAMLFGWPKRLAELAVPEGQAEPLTQAPRRAIASMWLARLLVQIAEAALFAYLLFWFRTLDSEVGEDRVASIFGLVLAGSIPLALAAGWWSDRGRRPTRILAALAFVGAAALLAMAEAGTVGQAVAAYMVFGLATGAFLSLHSAQTLGVLPNPARRGRDLGFFNLTNTVPSLIMPWLAIGLVPSFGFPALFLSLAALAAGSAGLLLWLDRQ